jgi:hypothetical protein
MRPDYGCHWDGDIVIRNCVWYPASEKSRIYGANNTGDHDFGYVCKCPTNLVVDGLTIKDGNFGEDYEGLNVFSTYDSNFAQGKPYPYVETEKAVLRGVKTESGKSMGVCSDPEMFRATEVVWED